jgi:chloramphenicol-sensitive protein RarD
MNTAPPPSDETRRARSGVFYGLAAYSWWGLVVLYFKAVSHVPELEVLAHRVLWSMLLLGLLVTLRGRWREAAAALRNRKTALTLVATTVLVASNWFVFIWAMSNNEVVQASLGYFINPLVNVLLGFLFLKERLRKWQWFSVVLAFTGVAYMTLGVGQFPWIAVFLATAFGLYGLLRKTVAVDSLLGQTVETAFLLPVALGYLGYLALNDSMAFLHVDLGTDVLLMAAGVVTATPLLWFATAARRLRLATLGFLQYIAPTSQLLLGVLVFGEAFTQDHQIAFTLIWAALAVYTADAVREQYANARRPRPLPQCESAQQNVYGYCICQAAGRAGKKGVCRLAEKKAESS